MISADDGHAFRAPEPDQFPGSDLTTPDLPAGTYPAWSLSTQYEAGDKVLYQGLPYQAKWSNQGVSPATESTDPSGSAWAALYSIPGEPSGAPALGAVTAATPAASASAAPTSSVSAASTPTSSASTSPTASPPDSPTP